MNWFQKSSGYIGDSWSEGSQWARDKDYLPASLVAQALGMEKDYNPALFIKTYSAKAKCYAGWHHVGSGAARVPHYKKDAFEAWWNSPEGQALWEQWKQNLTQQKQQYKQQAATGSQLTIPNCDVFWVEEIKRDKSYGYISVQHQDVTFSNVTLVDISPQFVLLKLPDGRELRKNKKTKSFRIKLPGDTSWQNVPESIERYKREHSAENTPK